MWAAGSAMGTTADGEQGKGNGAAVTGNETRARNVNGGTHGVATTITDTDTSLSTGYTGGPPTGTPVTGPGSDNKKDQLTNSNFYSDYQNNTKQKGHLIAPPLTQHGDPDSTFACMILALVDEVLDTGAEVKNEYTREDVKNKIKDTWSSDNIYSTDRAVGVLNQMLLNKRVSKKSMTVDEFKEWVNKGNTISDNQRFTIEFTQKTYWGEEYADDEFHWVGYRGNNSHNVITFDPNWGEINTDIGTLNDIMRVLSITITNK